jgi:hypothetical protein
VNENPLQHLWTRSSACLVVSPLAFVIGGALAFTAVAEDFHGSSRGWLVIALAVLGAAFFSLGVTTWARALALIVRARRSTASD